MWKRTLLFTVLYPGTVCLLLPAYIVWLGRGSVAPSSRWALTLGILFLAIGLVGCVTCATRFAAEGQGTPAPYDPPRRLVRGGWYAVVRNPMYLSIVSILVGEATLYASAALWIYASAVAIAFHLRVVLYEEPRLREQFGNAFDDYRRAVPRWFPRLSR